MDSDEGVKQEIAKMEEAAKILMGENSPLEQRREAEAYFVQLREANLDPNLCRIILETTREPVVMFQIAQCLCASLVKSFITTSKEDLLHICKYMLEMPLNMNQLPGYVVAEVLKVSATLIKRGIIAPDSWDVEFVVEYINKLLESTDENLQALGLRVVEAISLEFSTMWRASTNMGFDCHHKAKRKFEESLLKRFMQMSLTSLSRILSNDSVNERVCDRFLKVAAIVLQWNFTTSIKTAFLKVNLYAMNTAVALRPPPSWADLFTNEELLPFFFGLHQKVRHNSQLADNSLSCLTQLASIMGSVLDSRVKVRVPGVPQPHDLYVQRYCHHLCETFENCFPYEVLSFTTALHRIFSHHPMPIFKRFPHDLMTKFIKFIVHWCGQLADPAMMEKKDEESVLVESYAHCLTCWGILLRSSPTFPTEAQKLIEKENENVIESFLKAVLAPPFGSRGITEDEERGDEMEDDDMDDTQFYSPILGNVGAFCRLSIDKFAEFITSVFHQRIQQRNVVAAGQISENDRILWLEDIHWILLIIGSFFHDSDREVYTYLNKGYLAKKFQLLDVPTFLIQCASSDEFQSPDNADPVTVIVGLVCHWFGIAFRALDAEGENSRIVSAEVYRTTFLTFSTVINYLTNLNDETPSQFFDDAPPTPCPMPILPSNGEFSMQLIEFVIKQIFTAFKIFPSERKLCNAAVSLLLQESVKRAEFIAKSPLLYQLISSITLERLPARRTFMTCLVTIGSNVNSTAEREQMHNMILKPMADRFMEASQQYFAGDRVVVSHMVDLLECFSGVARAAQIESGSILYEYLLPILRVSSNVIKIAVDSQSLVEAILDVFHKVATTVFVFMDLKTNDTAEENSFIMLLMELLDNYKESQLRRFSSARAFADLEQEEQIADLVILLKTISNTISKPYIMCGIPSDMSDPLSTPLCEKTLNFILPLMAEECLQLPSFSAAFFRLLQHVTECCPMVFLQLGDENINKLFLCFVWALSGAASTEPTRLTLECISMVTKMLSNSTDTANGPFSLRMFNDLCAKTFEMAVHSTGEVELHVCAIKAAYGFIALNKNFFMEYVNSVVSRPENVAKQEIAVNAFMALIPQATENLNSRIEYKAFSDRFEKFLEVSDNFII
ncbi:unnamed protein product [Bursaphelenchus okinawaensis]|uniref:Exportin-4 n=1 Tax=Bursaphelenchus okinawaensis TaxID=465554 RepID=A0A811KRL0_9BILA|nr:unnamed protein product [Bursaphelenchus okinawaensis]CAG9111762.1 unnamed protein product [Bursaphelenchus okinawaensis]